MRSDPSDKCEMVNQVLYGEIFKVLEQRKKWSNIRLNHDGYEGWIDNKQYLELDKETYASVKAQTVRITSDPVQFVQIESSSLQTVVLGSSLQHIDLLSHHYEADFLDTKREKKYILETAALYLKTPYLWGGRSPFGIDCSGFTQMVYRINGHQLLRDASQQATQGEPLSFIEESEPGDLAFFDNKDGDIVHVGIIMRDNYIIHAHGEVRIDRLDHTGIYNAEKRTHTHKLRVIKKIIS